MRSELSQLHDFAARCTAAGCSQDAPRAAALFPPDGSLSFNGARAVGRRAITGRVQSFITAFPDLKLLMDDNRRQGDSAAYHWTVIGSNMGPGGTGHRFRFSGFEFGSSERRD